MNKSIELVNKIRELIKRNSDFIMGEPDILSNIQEALRKAIDDTDDTDEFNDDYVDNGKPPAIEDFNSESNTPADEDKSVLLDSQDEPDADEEGLDDNEEDAHLKPLLGQADAKRASPMHADNPEYMSSVKDLANDYLANARSIRGRDANAQDNPNIAAHHASKEHSRSYANIQEAMSAAEQSPEFLEAKKNKDILKMNNIKRRAMKDFDSHIDNSLKQHHEVMSNIGKAREDKLKELEDDLPESSGDSMSDFGGVGQGTMDYAGVDDSNASVLNPAELAGGQETEQGFQTGYEQSPGRYYRDIAPHVAAQQDDARAKKLKNDDQLSRRKLIDNAHMSQGIKKKPNLSDDDISTMAEQLHDTVVKNHQGDPEKFLRSLAETGVDLPDDVKNKFVQAINKEKQNIPAQKINKPTFTAPEQIQSKLDPKHKKTFETFIKDHGPLIYNVISNMRKRGVIPDNVEHGDVIEPALNGLMEAASTFNPNRIDEESKNPLKFETHASRSIGGHVKNHIAKESGLDLSYRNKLKAGEKKLVQDLPKEEQTKMPPVKNIDPTGYVGALSGTTPKGAK